jgi:recombination protein RecA
MKEQERRHAIELKLSRMEVFPRRPGAVSTGFAPLNAALDTGGFPRGAIVEIFGPSCGKTTLALQTVARLQETGGEAGWIDADRTFDPRYAAGLGVALDRLPLARPDSAEQALEIACQLAASGALDLLVVDSAAALTPQMEMRAAIGESGPGLHSRVLASGLRKLARAAARAGVSVVFLNQVRSRPESGGETSAGGPPLKLYAAVRIRMSAGSPRRMRFRVLKNRAAGPFAAGPFKEGELEWKPGRGFAEAL